MTVALIVMGIIFILYIIGLYLFNQFFIINSLNIKINEAVEQLISQRQKNINILTKLSKSINKEKKKKVLQDILKLKNDELDMFDIEKKLHVLNKELNDFIEDNKYSFDDKNNNLYRTLENGFIESKSIKIYYNSQVEKYNRLIKKIRFFLVKIIMHLKKKELFEFEEEVEFEILKK